jgi:hypothetical protein
MSSSKRRWGRGTTWHHLSDLGQMLQTPRLWIRLVLSTTYLESCPVLAKNNPVTNNNIRNSWSTRYIHKVASWRLFDHKKRPDAIMPGCFSVMPSFFFWDLFVTFSTTRNFCKLFFTVRGGRWVVLIYFSNVQGQGVPHNVAHIFFINLATAKPTKKTLVDSTLIL